MHSHLSSEQLDGALHGQPSPGAKRHLSGCPHCAEELNSLREVFADLRSGTTALTTQQRHIAVIPAAQKMTRIAWALAAAVLAVSVAAPLAPHLHKAVQIAAPTANSATANSAATLSDDALLESVQNDLSFSVPSSLLPLASVTTLSTSTNAATAQRKYQ